MPRKNPKRYEDPEKLQPAEMTVKMCLLKTGCNPLLELCKMVMAKDDAGVFTMREDRRIEVLKELSQYLAPKLRSSEVTGTVDHTITVNIRQFGAPPEPKAIEAEVVKQIEEAK